MRSNKHRICPQLSAQGLTASWDAMCKDLKGKSASEILIDLEVVVGVVARDLLAAPSAQTPSVGQCLRVEMVTEFGFAS